MRVMALDVGDKRIGVAVSDPTGLVPTPLTTIGTKSESEDIEAVLLLADEHAVEEIVVGLPLSLSGQRGPQARKVARFAESLSGRAAVPVTMLDERYSTAEAERLLREAGVQPARERARTDAAAAAVILRAYLDSRRAAAER